MATLVIQIFDTSRILLTNYKEDSPTEEERAIPFTNSPLDNFRGSNQNLTTLVGDASDEEEETGKVDFEDKVEVEVEVETNNTSKEELQPGT